MSQREDTTVSNAISAPDTKLIFLFDDLSEIQSANISNRLSRLCSDPASVIVSTVQSEGQVLISRIQFDHHVIEVSSIDAPAASDPVNQALACSQLTPEAKKPLLEHRAHVTCTYHSGDENRVQQLLTLFKLADALSSSGLLGIVDEDAWYSLPLAVYKNVFTSDFAETFAKMPVLGMTTGFVKFMKTQSDVWFCTKGLFRWDAPDFAIFDKHENAEAVYALLTDLASYACQKDITIHSGETASIGSTKVRFSEVTEFRDYLQTGDGRTLVIEVLAEH